MGRNVQTRVSADIQVLHPAVTGSCIMLVIRLPNNDVCKVIVDCGLFQEPELLKLNSEPFPFRAEDINAVLVTHNHVDHIGRIPKLVKSGYCGPIFATDITAELMPLALGDTYKILATDAKINKKKPIYSEKDVSKAIELIRGVPYEEMIQLHPHVECCFLKNGHIVGSAMILVKIAYPGKQEMYYLFTGDYKRCNYFTGEAEIPDWVKDLPLHIVCEATYGEESRKHNLVECFKQNIIGAITVGKTVVIPVFAFERGQIIFDILRQVQEENNLFFPICADGKLLYKYTRKFLQMKKRNLFVESQSFLPNELKWVDSTTRNGFIQDDEKCVFVITSGMGTHGPAQTYIPMYARQKNACIHFVGYQCEGTLGRNLQDAEGDLVKLNGQMVNVMAQVLFTNEFSGHAKPEELLELLKSFPNVRTVSLNHGTEKAKEDFAKRVISSGVCKNVNILERSLVFRFDAWGVTKVFSSKFS